MKDRLGYLAVLVSSVGFGFNGYFGKVGYEIGYTPLSLLTIRFLLAALWMWGLAALRNRSGYRVDLRQGLWLALQGVAYGVTALGFFNALQYLPAGLVGVFFYVHPLLTMLVARLVWREAISSRLLVSAAVAFLGVGLVSQSGQTGIEGHFALGFIWIMISAASYSGFTLLGKTTTASRDSIAVTTYAITFCALFLCLLRPPVYLIDGTMTGPMWQIALGISLVSTVMAILLYVVGIKSIGASRTAVLSAFEPLSGVVLALWLLGERLVPLQWAGISLIILAVWNLERRKKTMLKFGAESV